MVSPLHHMASMQEYCLDWFWEPWCISLTFPMVHFQELEFMQIILLHISVYNHQSSLSGVKSGSYHLKLPRPNYCLLIATESILIPLNDIGLPECASFCLLGLVFTPKLDWKLLSSLVAKQASQRVGSLFRFQRYLTPETILYFYKDTIPHVWSTAAPIFGVVLHNRVAFICLIGSRGGWSI